jgi:uncharacterized protein YggE
VQVPVNVVLAPGIVTTGDATVHVKPDAAIVSVGMVVQAAKADEAQAILSRRIANVLERAKALAIEDKDTKTVGYRIDPQYAYGPGKAPRLTGFQAKQQITLTLRGIERVGNVLDALVQADGANTAMVAFTLLDPKAAQASAREQAIQDAVTKAQAMARTAGVKLGKVIGINDIGLASTFEGSAFTAAFSLAEAAPQPQLPTGELQVVVRVQVQFELVA